MPTDSDQDEIVRDDLLTKRSSGEYQVKNKNGKNLETGATLMTGLGTSDITPSVLGALPSRLKRNFISLDWEPEHLNSTTQFKN